MWLKKTDLRNWCVSLLFITALSVSIQNAFGRRKTNCGLVCYRWGKCKLNLLGLTSGSQRPGQAGTTGQLFFSKCGDPPKGCECKFEAPKVGPRKPKIPKVALEFVNDDALEWISNYLEPVNLREIL